MFWKEIFRAAGGEVFLFGKTVSIGSVLHTIEEKGLSEKIEEKFL